MKKLCTFGGCKEIVDHNGDGTSPRCTQHSVPEKYAPRVRYEHHYDHNNQNIYKSARWKRTRKAKLMLFPLCEHCLGFNRSTVAQMVDHIIEIEDGGEVWDFNNLQSLCNAHHNTKTGVEKKKRRSKNTYPKLSDF